MPKKTIINPFNGSLSVVYISEGSQGSLGIPTDGTFSDGIIDLTTSTSIVDAIDKLNNFFTYLIPPPPEELHISGYNQSLIQGFISNGNDIGSLTPGELFPNIILVQNIVVTGVFRDADHGMLFLRDQDGNEIDSISLETLFNENERNGIQTYPPVMSENDYIEISDIRWVNDIPVYQQGTCRIFLQKVINPGYNSFTLSHRVNGEEREVSIQIFYDNGEDPSISNISLSLDNNIHVSSLSGIHYVNEQTGINIDFTANSIFNKTYFDEIISIVSPCFENDRIYRVADFLSEIPESNVSINFSNKLLGDNTFSSNHIPITIKALTPRKTIQESQSISCLAYFRECNTSNDVLEMFCNENYRLPLTMIDNDSFPSLTGNWDSSLPLENGNAQVSPFILKYPHEDFTNLGYPPDQQNNTDYSGFSGNQVYARAFKTSTPRNNGSIDIEGISWNDINSNVKIEMKVPGVTGWLDLGKYYSPSDFSGADGNGNLVTHENISGGIRLNWTIGSFSTVDSDNIYILKITLISNSIEITKIEETG